MLNIIYKFLCRHRQNKWVQRLDRRLVRAHEAIENRNYVFAENGEARVLPLIMQHHSVRTILDVGANVGEWSELAAQAAPEARLHSFEPVPATFAQLQARCGALAHATLNNMGLSDAPGELTIYHSPDANYLATCVDGFVEDFHGIKPQPQKVAVTSGDAYCAEKGITVIDLLKIDVEGYESHVLKGFERMLSQGKISIIQFEYGYINIATKFLLKDFYDLLKPHGMVIGKIYPTYVDFRDYKYEHEDFLGPNYIAVHTSLQGLIKGLSGE